MSGLWNERTLEWLSMRRPPDRDHAPEGADSPDARSPALALNPNGPQVGNPCRLAYPLDPRFQLARG